jgi:EAL domain-containing protein (putative c-di-GMP-specific phosphodiesterase class I)
LQAFPFDKLKIDRQFVEHLGDKKQAAMIVKSVLGLGKSLEIPVLAEGVETPQQLAFLSSENCTEVQGFYFGRPVSAENIRPILASGHIDVEVVLREARSREAADASAKVTPIEARRRRRGRPSAA